MKIPVSSLIKIQVLRLLRILLEKVLYLTSYLLGMVIGLGGSAVKSGSPHQKSEQGKDNSRTRPPFR